MKSLVATLGAVSLLAFAAVPAPAQPADPHVPDAAAHRCDPAEQIGQITLCNPLDHYRGLGAGMGRL
jgi:hypothetical protein